MNPVASPHFNFTVTEPMGIIGILAPEEAPLLGLLSLILPAITSGNTVVALASTTQPYPSILLGEMLATSDLPGGVVNLLTGQRERTASRPSPPTPTSARSPPSRIWTTARPCKLGAADSVKRLKLITAEDSDRLVFRKGPGALRNPRPRGDSKRPGIRSARNSRLSQISSGLPSRMPDAVYVHDAFARIADRYVLTNHVLSCGMDIWWRKVVTQAHPEMEARPIARCRQR